MLPLIHVNKQTMFPHFWGWMLGKDKGFWDPCLTNKNKLIGPTSFWAKLIGYDYW
jgi:hypothetical protein